MEQRNNMATMQTNNSQIKLNKGGSNTAHRRHKDKESNWVGNKAHGTEADCSQMIYVTKQINKNMSSIW